MPDKKKKATAKKATPKKATPKKAAAKESTVTRSTTAGPGDTIIVDSQHVGAPGREGEVLEVLHGGMRITYRVKWLDGHESLFTPAGGNFNLAPG